MKGEEKHGDEKIQYLQMIQNIIDRMSTTSAIFKGFCSNYCSRSICNFFYRDK